jgi:hypothetical protein
MLDLNKEFLEQEYSHNLEKRQHIIACAKELENEPVIQKALNELQYLHKLWKEEAEPVAEEFREKTWEEFKEISNKIHERKSELSASIEKEQVPILKRKIRSLEKSNFLNLLKRQTTTTGKMPSKEWKTCVRSLKTGVYRENFPTKTGMISKQRLEDFNTTKNNYYKSLKGSQQANLEEKLKLIQTAQDNMNNEEWDIAVPLFKKLQEDWKKLDTFQRA